MAKSAEEEKIAKIIQNQNKLLDDQLAKEKQLAVLQKERTGYMEREADAARTRAEEAKARLDMASEAMQISEKERKARLAIIDAKLAQAKIDADEGKISKEKLSDIQKYHDQLAPILSSSKKQLEILHKQAEAEAKKLDIIKKQKEAAEGLAKAIENATGASTGINNAWKTGDDVGSRLAQAGVYGTDLKDVLGGVTSGLKDSLNPANLLGSTIKSVVSSTADLFTEMDQSLAEFRRETGLSPEFESSITDVRQEMVHLGATTRDIVNQFNMLAAANSAFVFQNARVRESLQKTTAAMAVAYDAEQEFAEAVGFSMTAMAESPKQAEKTAMGLAKFAKDIKASPKEMMADYASLGPRLAAWGKNATKVFKETAAAAKALNIESAALLDIAGQFDTFDEAAGHVGQLNAMLGGDYFDTVEMVNASESERIEMLMEGVRATGKSWDSLGRFERKAIATAAGISDMAEANKMFGQGLDVYKELQSNVNDATMSYNDLSDAAIKNMSIDEKKAALYKSLALSLEPLIDLANMFLGVTQKLAQATGAWFPLVAVTIGYITKWAWAQMSLNAVTIKGLALGAKNLILRTASATLRALEISRETRLLILGKSSIKQRIFGLAIAGKELIVRGALAAATWFQNTAIGAYIISTIKATAAQWGLNAAMYANPVGLIVAGIVLLIAAMAAVVVYWEELVYFMKSAAYWAGELSGINFMIELFTGSKIKAPKLEDGKDNFSGTAIVGDSRDGKEKPEVVTTQGANIISNENLTRQIETNERVTQAVAGARMAERATTADPLESVFEMIGRNLGIGGGNQQGAPAMAAAGPGVQTQVIMEIDGEKFGKVVLEPYLEKILKPKVEA